MSNNGKHSKKSSYNLIIETLLLILFLTSIVLMIYSGFKIYMWSKENKKNANLYSEISSKVTIDESNEDIQNKYKVDFKNLKQINDDIVGWLKVEGTNIDYTVVKASDNDFYLKHSLDKVYNSAGWVFADSMNKLDGTDKNIVIYGHNRRDGSMFGTLKNILNENWYENVNNRYIPFITENEEAIYEVFSVYQVAEEDYYIKKDFNDGEFQDFLNTIKSRSIHEFNVDIENYDNILTLSTCANDNRYRVVLHAKKINNL